MKLQDYIIATNITEQKELFGSTISVKIEFELVIPKKDLEKFINDDDELIEKNACVCELCGQEIIIKMGHLIITNF